MSPENNVAEIPFWVIASIGKNIALDVDFVGPCETYLAGSFGKLVGLMYAECECEQWGTVYALVALDPDDDTYMENFRLDDLRPMRNQLKFSVDMEFGVIAF
jgi:hypothetical protein